MAPIRLALIGLSPHATTSWARAAHLPYLLSPRGRERFQIVGLLNSTPESGRAAAEAFLRPEFQAGKVRVYASPEELAGDVARQSGGAHEGNVDLVVCVTRVDKHLPTVLPAVKAGANVFVEWPLGHNVAAARELAGLAAGRTVVGLQGRLAPVVRKVGELVTEGTVGKVVSVEVRAAGGTRTRDGVVEGLEYFTRLEVGGNVVTIGFAHGEWFRFSPPFSSSYSSTLSMGRLPLELSV